VTAIIAIDPGLTGAIAFYDGERLAVDDMPVYTVRKATRVNLHDLAAIIANARIMGAYDALVEHVGAMPKQGVASAFNFGFTTGAIHGILAALGMESHTVVPAQWRFGVGLMHLPNGDKRDRKAASRARAIELFPDYAHLFARAKDDGRADAALMAWWYVNKHARAGA
jgi:hypothetical protein